jgi:hypothetical protein
MSASLEFDPEVMLAYFTDGQLAAQSYCRETNGHRELVDIGDFVMDLE